MKKLLSLILCGVLVLGVTGCGNKKEAIENEKIEDNIIENDKKDENSSSQNSSDFDYVVYCELDKMPGRKAYMGTGSYLEYYINTNTVIGIKYLIIPPTTATNSDIDSLEKSFKEEETYDKVERDGRKIILTADKNNSIVKTTTVEDLEQKLSETNYCYKK